MLLNQHGQFPRKSIVRCLEKRRKWEGGGNLHGIYMYVFFYAFWQDTINHPFNVTLIKTHSECHCCNNHSYFVRAKKLMYTVPILLKKSIVVPLLLELKL
uniref:Uncharacterized protein n=1 Tax=Zea mays TaxID=4577 RepID=C0HFW6_MAIZE|nr:unknown [Zea mays]